MGPFYWPKPHAVRRNVYPLFDVAQCEQHVNGMDELPGFTSKLDFDVFCKAALKFLKLWY